MKVLRYVSIALLIILGNAAVVNAASVKINSQNFPDRFFRYYVKMSFDQNEDGKLSDKEIEKITEIDVGGDSDYQLGYEYPAPTTLKGIEYFSNLKYIYASSCALNKLDVSHNRKLIFLNCMKNNLKTLDVSKNAKLKELYCDSNKLKKIQVAGNLNLEVLSISDNKIKKIDTSKLIKLQKLYVDRNKLRKLNVGNNKKLILLNCYGNKISKLDVTKNKSLDYLACSGNKLRSLDLSKNKLLQCLFCQENQLLTGNVKLPASQLDTYEVSKQKRTIQVRKIGKHYYVPLTGVNKTNVISKLSTGKITSRGIRLSGKKIPAKITYEYNMFTDGKIKTQVEIKVKK